MTKSEITFYEKVEDIISANLVLISVLLILGLILGMFHYLEWWDAIGLLILNLGLGVKLHGAKTFAVAVAKSGGKKALAMTTAGVLLKRHIIDLASKFFAEHSVGRYKKNIVRIVKMKFDNLMASTPMQKAKTFGSTILSIPIIYFVWSKILGTAIQKFLYALVYPLFIWLFDFIAHGFGFITSAISFILQLTLLNYLINWMERRPFGRAVINWVSTIFVILGDLLDFANKLFQFVGLDPKHKLIVWSIQFNRWLERIIHNDLNGRDSLIARRRMHLTSREMLVLRRKARKEKEKESLNKKFRNFYDKKVLKKRTWQEKREERKGKK